MKHMFLKSQRDKKKFKELAFPHVKLLYNVALKLTGKGHTAEDLVQETMYNAFKSFHQLKDEVKIRGWLISILRNAYLREAGRSGRVREVEVDDGLSYADSLVESVGKDPETLVIKKVEASRIQAIIDMLPEKYRTPLVLFYMEETSYRDIANSLDIPMGTVMSSISRGRALIKKELLKGARAAGSGEAGQDVNMVVSIKKARNLDGL